MAKDIKESFRPSINYMLSDSSDEEFVSSRKLKKAKTRDANEALNSRNYCTSVLENKKSWSKFYECNSVEFASKEKEILKDVARKNFGNSWGKYKLLVLKQAAELAEVKEKFVESLTDELGDWKKYNVHVKYHEDKLYRELQKLMNKYNLMRSENNKLKKILEIQKTFIKEHGEVMRKYELEVETLKDVINEEISNLKTKLSGKY